MPDGSSRARTRTGDAYLPRVFLSYRREDTGPTAAAFATLLRDHLSSDVVFFDRDQLTWGASWWQQLADAIAGRDELICLIGAMWEGSPAASSAAGEPPTRRIDEMDDPIRREILLAIEVGVPVLPVTVDRPEPPDDLPSDIEEAILVPHIAPLRSSDFESDFAVILVTLWERRVAHLPAAHVVLTVGTRDIRADEFISALGHQATSSHEVRVVTLAATGRMTLSIVEAQQDAPKLYTLYLCEDADERDRRVVAAFGRPGPWGHVVVAGAIIGLTYGVDNLVEEPSRTWLHGLIREESETVEIVGDAEAGAGLTASAAPPVWSSAWASVRAWVSEHPAVSMLIAAALALVVAGGYIASLGDDSDAGERIPPPDVGGPVVTGDETQSLPVETPSDADLSSATPPETGGGSGECGAGLQQLNFPAGWNVSSCAANLTGWPDQVDPGEWPLPVSVSQVITGSVDGFVANLREAERSGGVFAPENCQFDVEWELVDRRTSSSGAAVTAGYYTLGRSTFYDPDPEATGDVFPAVDVECGKDYGSGGGRGVYITIDGAEFEIRLGSTYGDDAVEDTIPECPPIDSTSTSYERCASATEAGLILDEYASLRALAELLAS